MPRSSPSNDIMLLRQIDEHTVNYYGSVSLYPIHVDIEVAPEASLPNSMLQLLRKYNISHNTSHCCWGSHVGSSGKHISWICGYLPTYCYLPHLFISNLNTNTPPSQDENPLFECEIDTMYSESNNLPALWGLILVWLCGTTSFTLTRFCGWYLHFPCGVTYCV